jgi:adenosylhomocysteine nucleosidase
LAGYVPELKKIAIIAALEREVRPLIKHWRRVENEHDGRSFTCFENESVVLVCGGIGAEAARRAGEAVVKRYQPELLVSAGFAGALHPKLKVGDVFLPARIIDAKDSSRTEIGLGQGTLISVASVASSEQKARLVAAYGAQAVDMESAAVAVTAHKHGLAFAAVKAISDDAKFEMPPVDRFVAADGKFKTKAFAEFAAVRPWLWMRLVHLSWNSARASRALCFELQRYIRCAAESSLPELQTTTGV